jgi:hypothetical protein
VSWACAGVRKQLWLPCALAATTAICFANAHSLVLKCRPSASRMEQVDWGLALKNGAACRCRGTETFAANGCFSKYGIKATPAVDVAAIVYTWLAIVHGDPSGDAPWMDEVSRTSWLLSNVGLVGVVRARAVLAREAVEYSW